MLIAINGRLINNDSTLRICRGTYFIFYFISIKIDRYFLGNVDSINFFTISPPQLFLSWMWEYLAIVSQLSTRDDPFDPFEVVARKKKVSQVISSTACSERPDKPIYLETCATSRTVFLAWCDGTLHVWRERLSTQLFRGCWWNFCRVETKARRDQNESSARGIRDAVSACKWIVPRPPSFSFSSISQPLWINLVETFVNYRMDRTSKKNWYSLKLWMCEKI